MADKLLYDVTKFGTVIDNELGIEVDDSRGRQGDKIITRLHPTSAGGGGQSSQIIIMNRYRPGNRYKYCRLNGTVVQFDAVSFDLTFATEADRDSNVIALPNTSGLPMLGVVEFGNGGPISGPPADPALTSHAAGVHGFVTVHGKVIANVNAAAVAGSFLAAGGGAAGRLGVIAAEGAMHVQAVAEGVQAAAFGRAARALVAEPPTQPLAWKANLTWVMLQ